MPGIPFLDNVSNYEVVCFVSAFIKYAPVVAAILDIALGLKELVRYRKEDSWSRPSPFVLVLASMTLLLFAFCFVYGADGRYSQSDVPAIEDGRTYFGTTKNNNADGFGKLFSTDGNPIYIGGYTAGKPNGYGRSFKVTDDGTVYTSYEGERLYSEYEGHGIEYVFIGGTQLEHYSGEYARNHWNGQGKCSSYHENGLTKTTYEGGYLDGKNNGYGTLIEYDEAGTVTHRYEGGWASSKKYGYGTEIYYENGEPTSAYRGLYWDNKRFGSGIREYALDDGERVVWVGFSNDTQTEDGAYYHKVDGEWTFWPGTENATIVEKDGKQSEDSERIAALKESWPFPQTLLVVE